MNQQLFRNTSPKIITAIILSAILAGCSGGSSGGNADYVALGASDATGVGAVAPFKGYAFEIRDELDERCESTTLINLGIPGGLAGSVESTALPVATKIKPDLVTLFIGPNDIVRGESLEVFEGKLEKILGDLTKDTDALIFVGNIPDLTVFPGNVADPDPDVTPERIRAFNDAIVRQTKGFPVTLVDLAAVPLDGDFFADDGYHPSNDGHHAIAKAFLDAIFPQFCGELH